MTHSGANDTERVLEEIWSGVLGTETFDRRRTFLELGGTSLAAEQMAAMIKDELAVELRGIAILRDNYSFSHLSAAVQSLRAAVAASRGEAATIAPA